MITEIKNFILSGFGHVALIVLGWRPLSPDQLRLIDEIQGPGVVVFPHTSYCDAVLGVIYLMAHPILRTRMATMVNEVSYQWWPRFLMDCFNAIPVPSTFFASQKNHTVQKCVAKLQQNPRLIIMLAPKGVIGKTARWRTSYYYIGYELLSQNGKSFLSYSITALGFDYEHHQIRLGETRVFHTRQQLEACCPDEQGKMEWVQQNFSVIPQLWPSSEDPLLKDLTNQQTTHTSLLPLGRKLLLVSLALGSCTFLLKPFLFREK